MAFQPGFSANATFTPTGGTLVNFNITGWTWDESVNALEVTHTGTTGLSAFVAGVKTGDFTFDANFDSAALPFVQAGGHDLIKSGVKGVLTLVTNSPTSPWSIGVMLEKVSHKSSVAGLIQYTVSGKLDQISLAAGVTYPT